MERCPAEDNGWQKRITELMACYEFTLQYLHIVTLFTTLCGEYQQQPRTPNLKLDQGETRRGHYAKALPDTRHMPNWFRKLKVLSSALFFNFDGRRIRRLVVREEEGCTIEGLWIQSNACHACHAPKRRERREQSRGLVETRSRALF